MNTREELLAKLRANEPFSKIRTEVHSISKLYEVSGQFLDERQTQLENLELRIRQAEEERDGLEAQVESFRRELENCRQEKQELEQENSRLTDEISEKTTELNLLKVRIDGFRAQGFTPEVMDKLEPMVDRGGEELLKQLQNIDEYNRTLKDHLCLKKDKASLVKEIVVLKNEKKKAQDSVVSVKNQIDELRLQARPIKDAVNIVIWLLKKGYTVEDLKSLGHGLNILNVAGDCDLSISRLVNGLKLQKSLTILREKVARKLQENAALEKAIADKKMRLKILEEAVLRSINKVCNASIHALRLMNSEGREALTTTCDKFDAHLQAFMANLQVQSKHRIEWVDQHHRRENDLTEQKILFETELKCGRFYKEFLASDDFLSTVSLPCILHISQRLFLWISMKLSNETIIPPASFLTQFGILNWPYNLKILAELVCLGLETVSKRQNG